MHPLETYAANCGAKIGKPYIYTSFFPLPIEKYITFHSDSQGTAKNYDYLQDVINMISLPLQEAGIRIVQIGGQKDRNFSNCINAKGAANLNQVAYIIQNSILHFGSDGFPTHLAGGFDIPFVSIFTNNFIGCDRPYFGSPEKQIFISSYDRTEQKKPSFSNDENPKTINMIKPEEIASAILKLLNIDYKIPFDSLFFGKKYSSFMIQECIPDHRNLIFNPELLVEIRADKPDMKEEDLFHLLAQYRKSIIVVDKPINLNIIHQFKQNIQMLAFKITENDHKDFLSELESTGVKLILISSLSQERINELKIKYYEYGIINRIEESPKDMVETLRKDTSNLYYRSSKLTASKNKMYSSQAAVEKDTPLQNLEEYQKVIDSPSFWEEIEFYTIVKKK